MIKIDEYFDCNKDDKIVIGCSTGPDSMALVDMLLKIREKYNLYLIVAHVNHNIREQSYDEYCFLKKYCGENNIIFESMTIEEYGDDNFHNEARNIRYNFFDSVVHKYNANILMTAHHGDDLMETILMRIVRGSNLSGYAGFKDVVEMGDYKIIRPLVHFTKDELLAYDIENSVKYFIDSSNSKDKYTRNRYRKYVLPFLKKEDKDVHLKFLKFNKQLIEANRFLSNYTENAMKNCFLDNKIIISQFLAEDDFIKREILYNYLCDYYQDDLILINDRHIDLILELIKSKKANSYVNLPNDVIAKKSYDFFYFERSTDVISSYEIEFDKYVLLPNNHIIEKVDNINSNSNFVCRLNSNEISLPLIVRTRRIGDKICVKGMNGSKKLKDIFIDNKIPVDKRDSWPIVLDSHNNIVWVPGVKKTKFDKKNNEEYDIILKYS